MARVVRDRHGREIHGEHVRHADRDRAEPAGEEHGRAAERAHHERLQQPALRIAAHDADRQEDGEHDAEEERGEHREPEDEGAHERARLDPRGRVDVGEVAKGVVVSERVEPEERRGEDDDDREHAPAHRLLKAVAHDGEDAHEVSPPTASR